MGLAIGNPILKIKTVTDKIIVESSQNTRVSTLPLESNSMVKRGEESKVGGKLAPHDDFSKFLEFCFRQGLSEGVGDHFVSRNEGNSNNASFIELPGIVVG